MSDLLRSLMTKEQLEQISQKRANHSRRSSLSCSFLNSNRAQIAQVALNKRVTMIDCSCRSLQKATLSNLLRLLMTKEQRQQFALFHGWITQNWWANSKPCVFYSFYLFLRQRANGSRHSLLSWSFLQSNFEPIAQVALNKTATMSDLLRLPISKERWQRSALFYKRIALLLKKKSKSLNKPMSKFQTLIFLDFLFIFSF